MSLNQEFGGRPLVPTGISGDLYDESEGEFRGRPVSQEENARRAYFADLAERFDGGAITPDEEAELISYLQSEALQGYN